MISCRRGRWLGYCWVALLAAPGAAAEANSWSGTGDVRAAIAWQQQDLADGGTDADLLPALRLRPGIQYSPDDTFSLRLRLAGQLNRDMSGLRFDVDGPARPGVFAIDTANAQWRPSKHMQLRVGRFQTAFELDSVVEDGLSRHDSGGLAVDWTDGLHLTLGEADGLRVHYIGQINRRDRSTNGVGSRGPVSFERDASRVTHFLGVEMRPFGPITQAMVDLTWIPDSMSDSVAGEGGVRDLLALTGRMAADFPIAGERVLHPAFEIGWIPVPPQLATLGPYPGAGRAQGLALVAGLDIRPLAGGALGLQLARVPVGFITSPDYLPNTRSAEVRYSWRFPESRLKLDVRYRLRQELAQLAEGGSRRTTHNVLLRATLQLR